MDLILEARTQGNCFPPDAKIQVLTDSEYTKGVLVLDWRAKANKKLIISVQAKIAEVSKQNPVIVHWVAGHSDIAGNEQADQLATQGARNSKAGINVVDPLAHQVQKPKPTSTPALQQQKSVTASTLPAFAPTSTPNTEAAAAKQESSGNNGSRAK